MTNIEKHLQYLGYQVVDKVTGFKGVVSSVSFDLYGCIQTVVTPPINSEGKTGDSMWFDINRLKITSSEPVMDVPNFQHGEIAEGKHGPCDKPLNSKF